MKKILLEKSELVWHITIKNESRCNAIDNSMIDDFSEILNDLESHPEVRVLTLQSSGDRFFSSGADIKDWSKLSSIEMGRSWIRKGIRLLDHLESLDQVTISVINGNAFGGGLELALATDLRIASEEAKFGFPEVGIGAIQGWYGIPRSVNAIGTAKAKKLALTGDPIDAQTAEDWGIVSDVAKKEELLNLLDHYIHKAIEKSPVAIAACKQLFKHSTSNSSIQDIHELAATACRYSEDGEEGISAFFEKRKPDFPGRKKT